MTGQLRGICIGQTSFNIHRPMGKGLKIVYSVLLVDDEPWILKGIRKTMNWSEAGFEVIGETSESQKAFEFICDKCPNVVFTDIRMPKISGIELMRMTRERGLNIEFVIITGFAEFSYAQEAIKLNAFDYLLKPVQRNEGNELLIRLAKHLDEKLQVRNLEILEDMNNRTNIKNSLKKYGFMCLKPYFMIMVVLSDGFPELKEQLSLFENISIFYAKSSDKKHYFFINSELDDLQKLVTISESYAAASDICIGTSNISKYPDDMPQLFKEADMAACTVSFLYGKGACSYKKSDIGILKGIIKMLSNLLESNDFEQLDALLDRLADELAANKIGIDGMEYLWNSYTLIVSQKSDIFLDEVSLDFLDYEQIFYNFRSLFHFCESFKEVISSLRTLASQECEVNINNNFTQILEYIDNHYNEELCLKDLSSRYFIGYAYCCVLFKKITAYTFSEYITNLRMKKASELLNDRSLTITDICYKIGYKDYFYFNKVFKKYHGVTPASYKKSM